MHAGIAGAGIMGRVLAWQLLKRGWQVSIFDARPLDDQTNCSFAAAGMLSPLVEVETANSKASLLYQLGIRSIELWAQIIVKLPQPIYFQRLGSLLFAHQQDRTELQRLLKLLRRYWPDTAQELVPLDHTSLQRLEPELIGLTGDCYFLDGEAQIASNTILQCLQQDIIQQGGDWHALEPVTQLESGTMLTQQQAYNFDYVFDCRGLGAHSSLVGLRPIRGEIMLVHAPEVEIQRPLRLVHPRYRLYIVPRPGHLYYVGASEIESEDYSPISVRTCLELLTAAYSVHRGFSEARIVSSMTQCRPTFSDHCPRIMRNDNLFSINGLYRHGYLLTPALVEAVLMMIEQGNSHCPYPELLG